MALTKAFQWIVLVVPSLLAPVVISAPTTGTQQHVLQLGDGDAGSQKQQFTSQRRLQGRFLHITDLHPDDNYKVHASTDENIACHRGYGPAGTYGAETSDCDSPLTLVNATFDWIKANLRDSIDFVVWTGDSARHDSDEEIPRHNKDILAMNRRIADGVVDTFSDDKGLMIPVVPTFGNNDIYPHNVLMPGPNDILKAYTDIWKRFIPEDQRHSFEFGGWFYVEVIPNKLAVFSLNTLYFFDRNAGVDDCVHPSEPGYKHFEWLRVQLQFLRDRGMKAILMGHVPPARTSGKQLWEETCWQKYTLWLQQYRDVVVGSLYGHMNIDHFLLQDTEEIDISALATLEKEDISTRESMGGDFSAKSSASYLMELRDDWSRLPKPSTQEEDTGDAGKKHKKGKKGKKGKNKLGGPWAERYQLSLISPSIVPNYFPTLRVFEYNITGLEDSPTWVDAPQILDKYNEDSSELGIPEIEELELRQEPEFGVDKKKGKKGKKGKKPTKDPSLRIPDPPAKGSLPGPAYLPQTLTFLGFTQYYANLTYINNDIAANHIEEDQDKRDMSPSRWNPGKHKNKKPQFSKPKPKEFAFEVEYSTFDDKIYSLQDLTVRSFVDLAHRIGKATAASETHEYGDGERETDFKYIMEADDEIDTDNDEHLDIEKKGGKKHKGGKDKKKKKKHGKNSKVWYHFLKHAFVSTRTEAELRDLE
ncbi:Endopolyphosphatase [Biscogniauxia mediterranea]|nr:Endopolyphosphatase [Biscogniauxia mediterranea]